MNALRTIILSFGRLLSYVGTFFAPLRTLLVRWIALPIYRILFFAQLRLRKTVASTRGLLFLLFTSRYTLHILLSAFALPIAFTQLRPASANAEVGQHSILYALVTNGQQSYTQETGTSSSPVTSSYLDETVASKMNIDFDYDSIETDPTTDHGLAGTVALRAQPSDIPDTEDSASAPEEPVIATTTPEPVKTKTGISSYTVKPGDTLASIAKKNGITTNTILWANNLSSTSKIRPGDTLTILPVSGVLYTVKKGDTFGTISDKYNIDLATLQTANTSAKKLAVGSTLIIPNGKPLSTGTTTVAVKPPTTSSVSTPKTTKTGVRTDIPIAAIKDKAYDVYQELANSNEDTRDKPADEDVTETVSKTTLLWPTARRVINQYYGWSHTGVDIDGDYTDPIYAAADGNVTEAGWNSGGYGLQVVIEHSGGLKTRYGHASKLFVKIGDEVKRGEVIGYVGTTGRSTGTHLHFEVYKNGKRGNPLAYIK